MLPASPQLRPRHSPRPVTAPRTQVTTQERPWNLFDDDIVTGTGGNTLILYTGASVEEHCVDDYPTATFRIRAKGDAPADGATLVERLVTRGPFHVYEGDGLDAVELIQEVCASGDAPEPVATGAGRVHQRIDVAFCGDSAAPDVTDVNGAVGVVRTPEGQRWVVRGAAKLTLSPEFSVDHVSFEVRNAR